MRRATGRDGPGRQGRPERPSRKRPVQTIRHQGAEPRPDPNAPRQMQAEDDRPDPAAPREAPNRAATPASPQMGGAVFDDWASI